MENNKISFGFSKISKKPNLLQSSKITNNEKKIELIDCFEEQSIKIKNAIKKEEKGPLVIPIKNATRNLGDRIREAQEKRNNAIKQEIIETQNGIVKEQKEINENIIVKQEQEEEVNENVIVESENYEIKTEITRSKIKEENDEKSEVELSIDELAARELIKDAQNREKNNTDSNTKVFTLPLQDEKLLIEGVDEPTNDDYQNVPIEDYGMAMLRGMGWSEGMTLGRNPSKTINNEIPELRPKGLGLGANKLVNMKKNQEESIDKNGKELILMKDAYAKIIAGNSKGNYCQILGLDDENSRIIVKTAIGERVLTLNEFLLIPVTKEEYIRNSKVLNNLKYEEYKEISEKKLEELRNSERKVQRKDCDNEKYRDRSSSSKLDDRKYSKHDKYKNYSDSESDNYYCDRRDNKSKYRSRSRSEDRRKSKKKSKKHSKTDRKSRSRSSSNDSDYERRRRKSKKSKSKSKHRSRRSRSSSNSERDSKYKK